MAWFCATSASVCAIISAKAVWAAENDADVAAKKRTASIMARKSRADTKMCCGGAADEGGGESAAPEKQNTKNYENVQLKMRKITHKTNLKLRKLCKTTN